jgi:hypothetical protein
MIKKDVILTQILKIFRKIVLFIPIIFLFAFPNNVHACSCVIPSTPQEEFQKFIAVFMGRVNNINEINLELSNQTKISTPRPGLRAEISVIRSWKGVTTNNIIIYTGYGGGDCGYPLVGYGVFVFYAYGLNNKLWVSICSRTVDLAHAQTDLDYLNTLPTHKLEGSYPTDNDYMYYIDTLSAERMGTQFVESVEAFHLTKDTGCQNTKTPSPTIKREITSIDYIFIVLLSLIVILLVIILFLYIKKRDINSGM